MSLDPVITALDFGSKLINHFFPDEKEANEAKLKLIELQQSGELEVILQQLEVNKIEAVNTNLFVSGWRPALGWVCVLALFYKFIIYPVLCFILLYFPAIELPVVQDSAEIYSLITGILGLGAMRSFEKLKGVQSK